MSDTRARLLKVTVKMKAPSGNTVPDFSDGDHPAVSETDVRKQLRAVLESDLFKQSKRMQDFLQYVVDETVAGRQEQLKEYTIAQDVFEKDDGFDPRENSVVRVEANRLRTKLEQYYNETGRKDDVIISMPKGGYVAVFRSREGENDTPSGSDFRVIGNVQAAESHLTETAQRRQTYILACKVEREDPFIAEGLGKQRETPSFGCESVFRAQVSDHGGKVVNIGRADKIAEFSKVDDAVFCGLALKRHFKEQSERQPSRIVLRTSVGIECDMITEADGIVSGPAVEDAILSRQLNDDPVGVCISGGALDQINDIEAFDFTFIDGVVSSDRERRSYIYLAKPVSAEGKESVSTKSDSNSSVLSRSKRKMALLAASVIVLLALLGIGLSLMFRMPNSVEHVAAGQATEFANLQSSIAVFPFEAITEDQRILEFTRALAHEIGNSLTFNDKLRVKATSSFEDSLNRQQPLHVLAEELNVHYVVKGRVQMSDSVLRVTVELIDIADAINVWAEKYDFESFGPDNMLKIQDEITEAVTEKISIYKRTGMLH